jgi:hypothetical protein
MGLGRVTLFMVSILVAAALFVAALPVRVKHAEYMPFEEGLVTFPCPEGWSAFDPFHHNVRRRGFGWLQDGPPPLMSRVAFLRAHDGASEAYLMRGPSKVFDGLTDQAMLQFHAHPRATEVSEGVVETSDGTAFRYQVVHARANVPGADPVAFLLATATRGWESVLVSAGGPAAGFDTQAVLGIVSRLELQ